MSAWSQDGWMETTTDSMVGNFIVGEYRVKTRRDHACLGKIRGDGGNSDIWIEPQKRARCSPPVVQRPSFKVKENKTGKWGKWGRTLGKKITWLVWMEWRNSHVLLGMKISSEKCILMQFHPCANIREHTCTGLDGTAYYCDCVCHTFMGLAAQ